MLTVKAILAVSKNNVIGLDHKIPWHLKSDMEFFKNSTLHRPVIMGYNTWKSLPGVILPERENYVLANHPTKYDANGLFFYQELKEVLKKISEKGSNSVYIIGGGELIINSLDIIDELLITVIDTSIDISNSFTVSRFPFPLDQLVDIDVPWENQINIGKIVFNVKVVDKIIKDKNNDHNATIFSLTKSKGKQNGLK